MTYGLKLWVFLKERLPYKPTTMTKSPYLFGGPKNNRWKAPTLRKIKTEPNGLHLRTIFNLNSRTLIEEINNCNKVLQQGGLILYPTDTVWGIGCDATNPEAVKKVYALKKREDTKALICLVANQAMLERHVKEVPDVAYDIMDLATKPTTIVFDNPMGIASNLVAEDNTLAIRVASDKFCQYLINKFRKPIVSTSANISGNPTPKQFKDIDEEILKGVDYVVNLQDENKNPSPSSIIKLSNDGKVKVIRE